MTIKELVKKEPHGTIAKAYKFAETAHKQQKRKTGEPYFVHPLATADILNQWHLDEATIVGGLLHDTVEDTNVKLADITREFGDQVAFLVAGVTKLGRIKYRGTEAEAKAELREEALRRFQALPIGERLRLALSMLVKAPDGKPRDR